MLKKRCAILALALLAIASGAWAQAKPNVGVLSVDSPLYTSAVVSESRVAARLVAGDPLLIIGSQDKKIAIDGVPTLWYQAKTAEGATGWIPGSRLSFSPTAFKRSAFSSEEQYSAYFLMAARPGDKVVAARSYEKVAKGDVGYYVSYHDGGLPVAVVWERNLDATPAEEYLPSDFPEVLQKYVYYVTFPVVELAGESGVASFGKLAKDLPNRFPTADGFYASEVDDEFPWYTPPEASYGYSDDYYDEYGDEYSDDYGYYDEYGDDYYGDYDDDYVEGEESYGKIKVGSSVILGKHDDVNGGANWADEMDAYVGTEAVVSSLPGADSQGFLVVRVDGNGYVWRVRNLTLADRGETGSYGYQVGDKVILGAHRYIDEDNNWADDMLEYVGRTATITEMEGTDGSNCYIVHVDIDNGDWYWRVETMQPAE